MSSLCSQDSLWSACCETLYSTSSRYQALRTQCLRPEGLKGLQSWLGAASMKEVYRVRACNSVARAAPLSTPCALQQSQSVVCRSQPHWAAGQRGSGEERPLANEASCCMCATTLRACSSAECISVRRGCSYHRCACRRWWHAGGGAAQPWTLCWRRLASPCPWPHALT